MTTTTDLNDTDTAVAASNLPTQSDEALLLEYRQTGAEELFAELVRRYERPLFNYLNRYLGSREMAQDVFQATFLRLHLKCEQFESGRRLRPWLYRIATNLAIDATRRNRRHQHSSLNVHVDIAETAGGEPIDLLVSNEAAPESRLEHQENRAWLRCAVEALPEQMAHVIKLIYFRGLKYREAAEELALPIGTVKSRAHKAMLRLNEAWLAQNCAT